MKNPTVSIIIPNYNYEQYLKERFESITNQTFQDYEIILMDDASQDNSVELLRKFTSHEKVSKLIINEQNSGSPFAQWEKGISVAKGKYIWIAEADDSAESTFLEELVSLIEKHQDVSIAFSASTMIDQNGKLLNKDYDHWERRKYATQRYATLYSGEDFVLHNMYWRNWIYNASGVIFRKTSIPKKINLLSMRYCEDWFLWSSILLKGNIIELHKRLNKFRFHNHSTTHQSEHLAFIEDIKIISLFNATLPIPKIKQVVRAGRLYRRAKKLTIEKQQLKDIEETVKIDLKVNKQSCLLDFLSKICPLIISESRDNIKGISIPFPDGTKQEVPK